MQAWVCVVRLSAGSVGSGAGRHWSPVHFISGQDLSITRAGHLSLMSLLSVPLWVMLVGSRCLTGPRLRLGRSVMLSASLAWDGPHCVASSPALLVSGVCEFSQALSLVPCFSLRPAFSATASGICVFLLCPLGRAGAEGPCAVPAPGSSRPTPVPCRTAEPGQARLACSARCILIGVTSHGFSALCELAGVAKASSAPFRPALGGRGSSRRAPHPGLAPFRHSHHHGRTMGHGVATPWAGRRAKEGVSWQTRGRPWGLLGELCSGNSRTGEEEASPGPSGVSP